MAQSRTTQARQASPGSRSARGGEEAVIGATTRIRGRVTGDGDLTIAGRVEGDIVLQGSLTIEDGASAASNVEAASVTVAGVLEGDVSASGVVTIADGARVRGNVRGAGIALEEGAQFAGRIDADFDLPAALAEESEARGAKEGARRR